MSTYSSPTGWLPPLMGTYIYRRMTQRRCSFVSRNRLHGRGTVVAVRRRRFSFACSGTRRSRRLTTIAAVVLACLGVTPTALASARVEPLAAPAAQEVEAVATDRPPAPEVAVSPQYHPDSAAAVPQAEEAVLADGWQVRGAPANPASPAASSSVAAGAVGTSIREARKLLSAERRYSGPIKRTRAISRRRNSAVSSPTARDIAKASFPHRIGSDTSTQISSSIGTRTCTGSSYASTVGRACGPETGERPELTAAAGRAATRVGVAAVARAREGAPTLAPGAEARFAEFRASGDCTRRAEPSPVAAPGHVRPPPARTAPQRKAMRVTAVQRHTMAGSVLRAPLRRALAAVQPGRTAARPDGPRARRVAAAPAATEIARELQDTRLMLQIGVGLGLLYIAFLVVWFWATRFRPGLQRSG
jgi:hypothetical protein